MAKVVLTIKDKKDGTVGCTCDFTPVLRKGKARTTAQRFASACLQAMAGLSEGGMGTVTRVKR